jgi:putative transcriptional regulator
LSHGRCSPSLDLAFQIANVVGRPLDDVFQYREAPGARP